MILCIVGPTGVGKTKLSIKLAKKYQAIIINADSTQVYKKMNIGTAKISEEEKEGIPHYLFDIKDVEENYTVYDYQKDARNLIEKNKDRNIIFVGGSGMYIKAVLYNYVFTLEEKEKNSYDDLSNEEIYKLALKKDKNMNIHPHNRKRLIRFLNKERIQEEECYPVYPSIWIGLTTDRDNLYKRIDKRVEEMFSRGLVEEVKSLYPQRKISKALNTAIGYKELFLYFQKEITLEEAKERIKKNSRHYAKRQYTWFNHQVPVKWFIVDFDNFNNTVKEVSKEIEKRVEN